jgi:hypothetical protein
MLNESVFQFTLAVFVLKIQENERVADVVVGGDLVAGFRLCGERSPRRFDRS